MSTCDKHDTSFWTWNSLALLDWPNLTCKSSHRSWAVLKYKTLFRMLSLKELSNQDSTMALFLCQRRSKREEASGQVHDPSTKASLCFVERAMITDLLQLSKLSPLKITDSRDWDGLSDGWMNSRSIGSICEVRLLCVAKTNVRAEVERILNLGSDFPRSRLD